MMKSMQLRASRLVSDDSGQSVIEYGLVVGLMALAAVAAGGALVSGLTNLINSSITAGAAAWPS